MLVVGIYLYIVYTTLVMFENMCTYPNKSFFAFHFFYYYYSVIARSLICFSFTMPLFLNCFFMRLKV